MSNRRRLLIIIGAVLALSGAAARAENVVRILFDDIEKRYRPLSKSPNPPTDGCRPAVDDSDDNGCVTEGENLEDDSDDEGGQ
jgi:hypothetical protein